MPKASDLKKGDVVEVDGVPHVVKQLESRSPSSRGAATLYKIRFNNLINGQKRDESVKGDQLFQKLTPNACLSSSHTSMASSSCL